MGGCVRVCVSCWAARPVLLVEVVILLFCGGYRFARLPAGPAAVCRVVVVVVVGEWVNCLAC